MKAADIKVGDRLAWSHSTDPFGYSNAREAEVIEVGVEFPGRYYHSGARKGTKVRFIGQDRERVVLNRELRMPWDEYVAERDRRNKAAAERAAERDLGRRERAEGAFAMQTELIARGLARAADTQVRGSTAEHLKRAGFEVVPVEKPWPTQVARSVFVNLVDHVERGHDLLLRAENVLGVSR